MANSAKLLELIKEHLSAGETVESSVYGTYETTFMGTDTIRSGILAATNKRLVFYGKKLTGYDFESFPYENISSFERGKNMMGGNVKFIASGNTVSMKWINDENLIQFTDLVQSRMGKTAAPTPAAQSIPEQIAALASLRDAGVLSDEEFQAKKVDLLNRM